MPTRTITLTNHEQIRAWAEARGGKPSAVLRTTRKNDPGILGLDFPGHEGKRSHEEIGWDEFFEKFDAAKLALVVEEKTAGGPKSNFNKLVPRTAVRARGRGVPKKKAATKRSTRARTAPKKKTVAARPKARTGRSSRTTRPTRTKKKSTARRTGRRAARS